MTTFTCEVCGKERISDVNYCAECDHTTSTLPKIFWDVTRGSVYWLEGNEVICAAMNNDNTADLDSNGVVEVWSEDGPELAKAEEARIRAKLA